ncbi:nuclear transport factor 2 family protein [Qipengyuania sp.]|uniref:nuclear transport factor 2 family protein n=1 Tax=Qipengyuania sp. TaxID=2004515 RepID=UPI0035C8297F|tara:strand:- start:119 stop:502 length:384 start_codon:yes stop_codon:yes gene_type:complete
MTDQEIEEFAAHFVDAVQRGDAEAMRACYAPDGVIWHNTNGEQSLDDNVKTLNWFVQTLPDRKYNVLRREVIPNGFVQQHILSATLPNGEAWQMDACVVVSLENGKIKRLDEYLDSAAGAKLREFGR